MPRRPTSDPAINSAMNGTHTNTNTNNNNGTPPTKPGNALDNNRNNRRGTPTYFLVVVVIVLLAGQFVFFQECQQDSLWASVTRSGDGPIPASSTQQQQQKASTGIQGGSFMKGQHFDVCIAGAGLSGAVLAERYASQLGATVLVVDKRDHIGGNCYDYLDVRDLY